MHVTKNQRKRTVKRFKTRFYRSSNIFGLIARPNQGHSIAHGWKLYFPTFTAGRVVFIRNGERGGGQTSNRTTFRCYCFPSDPRETPCVNLHECTAFVRCRSNVVGRRTTKRASDDVFAHRHSETETAGSVGTATVTRNTASVSVRVSIRNDTCPIVSSNRVGSRRVVRVVHSRSPCDRITQSVRRWVVNGFAMSTVRAIKNVHYRFPRYRPASKTTKPFVGSNFNVTRPEHLYRLFFTSFP